MEAVLSAGFGLVVIGFGVRALVRERRAARRGRRPVRPDFVAACGFLLVLGALCLLLAGAITWLSPR